MLLFLIACRFEDDPLPVLPDRVPRAQGTVADREAQDGEAPTTTETTDGVTGSNQAPIVGTVTVDPKTPTALQNLTVSASPRDPDGQFLNVTYEWAINGTKLLAENGPTLAHDLFHRGDVVTSSIIASDGQASARAETQITVQDAPPTITTRPEYVTSVDGLAMSAKDPDGDPLTWRLEGAPYGMTINPRSGEIAFKGAQVDQGGAFTVTVVVEDPEGQSASWRFSAEVKGGKTDDQAKLEAKVDALAQPKAAVPVAPPSPSGVVQAPPAAAAPPPPAKQASGQAIFQNANDIH